LAQAGAREKCKKKKTGWGNYISGIIPAILSSKGTRKEKEEVRELRKDLENSGAVEKPREKNGWGSHQTEAWVTKEGQVRVAIKGKGFPEVNL